MLLALITLLSLTGTVLMVALWHRDNVVCRRYNRLPEHVQVPLAVFGCLSAFIIHPMNGGYLWSEWFGVPFILGFNVLFLLIPSLLVLFGTGEWLENFREKVLFDSTGTTVEDLGYMAMISSIACSIGILISILT